MKKTPQTRKQASMAKRKHRRKQKGEATDSENNYSCKMTAATHSRRSHLMVRNERLPPPPPDQFLPLAMKNHGTSSLLCYDAVIFYPGKDLKHAYEFKTWLERDLPWQFGGSRHALTIELMGNVDSNLVTSLEEASKRTNIIIILCTKNFDHDALFRKAINGLWAWQAGKEFRIIHVLKDFGDEEPPPKCIPVTDANILRFKPDCQSFHYAIGTYLSRSLEKRLQHERERNEGLENQPGGQGVPMCLHPFRRASGDVSPTHVQQMKTEDQENSIPPESETCDSGVASASGFTSVATFTLSDVGLPCSQDPCSLSGPFGLPHDPRLNSASKLSSSPESSVRNSSGAPESRAFAEGTNTSVTEEENAGEEKHRTENENCETKSKGIKEPKVSAPVPASSPSVMKEERVRARSGQNRVGRTNEDNTPTKRASSSWPVTPPLSSGHQRCGQGTSYSVARNTEGLRKSPTTLNHRCVSLGTQKYPNSETDRKSNTSIGRQTTAQVPVCSSYSTATQLNPEGSKPNDYVDVEVDCAPVSEDPRDMSSGTSISAGVRTREALQGSRTEDSLQKPVQEEYPKEGYLTPISCCNAGSLCRHYHDPGESEDDDECRSVYQSIPPGSEDCMVTPPNHSYVNTAGHAQPNAHEVKTLPPKVHSYPSLVYLCNPIPDVSDVYDTAESVLAELQPGSININHARSVTIYGTKYQTSDDKPKPSVETADNCTSSDASTTYQTWPCTSRETDRSCSSPKALATEAESGRMTSPGPQLPTRCGLQSLTKSFLHDPGIPCAKTVKKRARSALLLSRLCAMLPCAKKKKKKKKSKTEEVYWQCGEISVISGSYEDDLYEMC